MCVTRVCVCVTRVCVCARVCVPRCHAVRVRVRVRVTRCHTACPPSRNGARVGRGRGVEAVTLQLTGDEEAAVRDCALAWLE